MHEWIQPIVIQYGLYAVFFIIMFESAGVPLPGETALLLASIYAGATGHLNIVYVIIAAATAAIIGDNIGFMIGRKYGLPLIARYGRLIGLDERRLAFGEYMFARHGAKIVFFGRFVAVLRIFAALLAGVNQYSWRSFLFYNAAGGICWATIFGLGGYMFGDVIMRVAGPVGMLGLVIAIGGLIGGFWVMRKQEHRYEQKALDELNLQDQQAFQDIKDEVG